MHFAANFVVQEQESWSPAQEDRSGLSMSRTLPKIRLPVKELSDGLDPRILPLREKNVLDGIVVSEVGALRAEMCYFLLCMHFLSFVLSFGIERSSLHSRFNRSRIATG